MLGSKLVGIAAGTGTTISFLPQVWKVFKTRSTGDLSLCMFMIHTTGVSLWILYGVNQGDLVIVVFNAIAMFLCLTILLAFVLFSRPMLPQ